MIYHWTDFKLVSTTYFDLVPIKNYLIEPCSLNHQVIWNEKKSGNSVGYFTKEWFKFPDLAGNKS